MATPATDHGSIQRFIRDLSTPALRVLATALAIPEDAPAVISGSGAPTMNAPIGSIYMRDDGAPDTLQYNAVDAVGTWVAVDNTGPGATQIDLIFVAATRVEIAAGVAAFTQAIHELDGQGDAADTLTGITGLTAEEIWLFRQNDSAGAPLLVQHGIGADLIACPGAQNIQLAAATDYVWGTYDGTQAVVLGWNTLALGVGGLGRALALTTAGNGAALVGVQDPDALVLGADVEAALVELAQGPANVAIETLAGAKTILLSPALTTDSRVQVLDPNAATRIVTLPAETARLWYWIRNSGTETTDILTVNNDAAGLIASVLAGESLLVVSDGTNWGIAFHGPSSLILASVLSGGGASKIGIFDTAGNLAATDVEAALAEIFTLFASVANGEGAALIGVEDAATYYAGATVEAILTAIGVQIGGDSDLLFNFTEANVCVDDETVYASLERLDLRHGDLASVANTEGASLVGVEDAAGSLVGATVEAALAEIATPLTLTPGAEAGDVLPVVMASLAAVTQYKATVRAADMVVALVGAFTIAETGAGAEVSTTARPTLLFTTDAAGAATLSVTDVATGSGLTVFLEVEAACASAGQGASQSAIVSITFD